MLCCLYNRSDEGLTLETSAFLLFMVANLRLTQLLTLNYLFYKGSGSKAEPWWWHCEESCQWIWRGIGKVHVHDKSSFLPIFALFSLAAIWSFTHCCCISVQKYICKDSFLLLMELYSFAFHFCLETWENFFKVYIGQKLVICFVIGTSLC